MSSEVQLCRCCRRCLPAAMFSGQSRRCAKCVRIGQKQAEIMRLERHIERMRDQIAKHQAWIASGGERVQPSEPSPDVEAAAYRLAETLAKHRREAGLTQQAVADAIGVTRGAYRNYEDGRAAPRWDRVLALSDVLRFDIAEVQAGGLTAAEYKGGAA